MTTLNPDSKAYFDPDFDVVDDMKFIDSLIRTMPEATDQQQPHSSEQLVNSYQTSSNKRYAGSWEGIKYWVGTMLVRLEIFGGHNVSEA